jgi:uncharacterized protein YcfJ
MDNKLILGLGALLAGGVAVAAWQQTRADYAQVVEVEPVIEQEEAFAQVTAATPVKDVVATPRRICNDVAVTRRLPERDGNAGGAIAGAVIGGLLGNQIGGGRGRDAATVAGAVAGGFAGREVDRRHVGGRVVQDSERRCETISEAKEQVVGYDVTYRTSDGKTGQLRVDEEPGERIGIGPQDRIVGYEVTYRYNDVQRTVRMDRDPGDRLPVIDGRVVLATDEPAARDEG